jgi:phytoene/squalene synthetase
MDVSGATAPPETRAALARHGGRAWGYAGFLRAAPIWVARGRSPYPRGVAPDEGATAFAERSRHAHAEARIAAAKLPSELFPAFGYLALVPRYLRVGQPALFARQLALVVAAATGRV